ncbi:MAG: bifunctional phosphoribosylaminoimidazolecarboxamide formyltransferase/IMP cyclohydrolase [Gemmatimonadota bacterium]
MTMPRALLSVSDKAGIEEFASELAGRGWTILSTGGTARTLRACGLAVTEVSEITGHPEIMDGRVKTLHPAVHAGLLARRDHAADDAQLASLGYEPIDLLAVNLYPFRETVARPATTDAEALEQIDIGGPAMLRAAAKNHAGVWVVVEPSDYARVLAELDRREGEPSSLRRELAAKVFAHTSAYDAAVAAHLRGSGTDETRAPLPSAISLDLTRVQTLRYGENPDQLAGFYREAGGSGGLAALTQLHGKELSFNNLLDVDGALLAISAWPPHESAACAIIKHTTPCGLAISGSVADAYHKALSTDPVSAFGSVVAFNREVTEECAMHLRAHFVEAVVAPAFSDAALSTLKQKKNLRLLTLPNTEPAADLDYKRVRGGFLVQERLRIALDEQSWKVVTERPPSDEERSDLRFAWRAVAPVKSNAILIARGGATLGIGAGQMSRVDSSRIAVMKAADNGFDLKGAVLASDAFFPFRDGVDTAAEAGVRAIIQPGGSVRDEEVIAAANDHDVAMVLTGRRSFRH